MKHRKIWYSLLACFVALAVYSVIYKHQHTHTEPAPADTQIEQQADQNAQNVQSVNE